MMAFLPDDLSFYLPFSEIRPIKATVSGISNTSLSTTVSKRYVVVSRVKTR